jgi:hypothetical protein
MLESWDERNAANLLRHLSVRGRVFWHTPCELTTPLACPPLACLSLACLLLVCSRSCLLAHLFELTTPAEIVSFGTTFCNPYPLSEVVSFGTPLPTLYALRGRVFWHTSLDLPIASDLTPRIDPPLPPLTSVTTSTSGGKTLTRGTPLPSNPPCPPLRWRTSPQSSWSTTSPTPSVPLGLPQPVGSHRNPPSRPLLGWCNHLCSRSLLEATGPRKWAIVLEYTVGSTAVVLKTGLPCERGLDPTIQSAVHSPSLQSLVGA